MKRLIEHSVRIYNADMTAYNRAAKERNILPLRVDGDGESKRIWFIELPIVIETKETNDDERNK